MRKGDRTKQAVLDHALARASERGLEGLSIGELAGEVGMSKSGLFAHFGSKEDLQLEVIRAAAERFVRVVIAPALREPRGLPRVWALFERWLAWDDSDAMPGGCVFHTFSAELDDRPGPLRDALVAYQRDWIDALAQAAAIAVDEGHFRPDLDTAQFAFEFQAIAMGYLHASRLLADDASLARARAAFERLVDSARTVPVA